MGCSTSYMIRNKHKDNYANEIMSDIMDNVTDAPMFSLSGTEVVGKVVSVYDGDTVKIIFPLHETLYKWNCRLSGVDTPELRTSCDEEKKYGYMVRDKLRDKILNKLVVVKCGEFDKYGRLLTTLICKEDQCDINEWLVQNKYAVKYEGKTKQSWSNILKDWGID